MRILLTAFVFFLSIVSSQATVSFLIQADLLKDSNGNAIPQNSTFLLVASTSNSTFSAINPGSSLTVGSLLNGDDAIVYRGNLTAAETSGVLDAATGGLNLNIAGGWNPGDPLALVWFPTLTDGSTSIAAGVTYGLYTNAVAVDGSNIWVTPSDPSSNYSLALFTKDGVTLSPGASASNLAAVGRATFTVAAVPEPNRALLLLAGVVGLAVRRRK